MKYILFCMMGLFCSLWAQADGTPSKIQPIVPLELQVTFDKTVHIIFPSKVKYVDLGSNYLIAGSSEETENIIRVKAAVKDFPGETNLSVVCENGSFYNFNVWYAECPLTLNLVVQDKEHASATVLLRELGTENPSLLESNLKSIAGMKLKPICHLSGKHQKMKFSVNGLFVQESALYLLMEIENLSHIPFEVDYLDYTIRDRKKVKRKAIQTKSIIPLRVYGNDKRVPGTSKTTLVVALPKVTFDKRKMLDVKLVEKGGERHQKIKIKTGIFFRLSY